ncbi:MAG: hypothetical protein ABFR32_13090 [Bacteroidota bacterium]
MKFTLIFLIVFSSFSQNQFVLYDATTKQSIAYANIMLYSNGKIIGGTYSDIQGLVSIDEKTDSIIISSLGYDNKSFITKKLSKIIYLFPKVYNLNEVVVSNKTIECKRSRDIGYFKKKKNISIHLLKNSELTTLISNKSNKTSLVKIIYFELKNNSKNHLPIRLKIYSNKKGPDKLLLSEDIEVPFSDKKKKYILNIHHYNIEFPKEGLFIGFEYLQSSSKKGNVYISATNKIESSKTFIKDKFWNIKWNSFNNNHFYRKLIEVDGMINIAVGIEICDL